MNRAVAHIVRTMSSTDSGLRSIVLAYAIRHGTVSLHSLSATIADNFPGDSTDHRYFQRINNFQGLRKTGRREGGTIQYEIDPMWAEHYPDQLRYYQVIAQEAF